MEELSDGIGELLRRYRIQAGATQREVADCAGLSVRALRNIEQNRVPRPHAESLNRLAAALGLEAADRDRLFSCTARSAGETQLRIGVLGPLTVNRADVPIDVGPDKHRVLLALLAIKAHQVVSVEEIVDVLWHDRPPRTCLDLVHTYVARLRHLLEPDRPRRPDAQTVAKERGGYRLDPDGARIDATRFASLAAQGRGRRAAGDLDSATELLAEALACWRGPALADLGPQLRGHPAVLGVSQSRLEIALACADLAIDRGRSDLVVASLRALAADEPLHEGLHARLMLALAGSGQQADALRMFADIRGRLADELGVEPSADLRAAHLRVLRQELPDRVAMPADAQVRHGRMDPQPSSGSAAVPAQLPAAVTAFTGRGLYLRQLDALLPRHAGKGARAMVITAIAGTAGVGKTALAVHWAHRVRHRFPDGQLYVNMRGYAADAPLRPLDVLTRLLRALGVPAGEVPANVDEAAAMYRTLVANRHLLIVLDNAQTADQVRPMLPGSSTCLVLITSRDRLAGLVATDGAHRLTLDVLSPAEAGTLLEKLLGAAARADPAATAELARLCGYLPLALRLAAANLADRRHRSVVDYVAQLLQGSRVAGLAVEGDDGVGVRAAFDLSYARLPPAGQRLFRMVGLVPGPDITAAAAGALVGIPPADAEKVLDRLAAAHLVNRDSAGRFGCHDLLRAYAADRAGDDEAGPERDAAVRRLFDWYLHGVDLAGRLLYAEKLKLPVPPPSNGVPPPEFTDHAGARAWLDAERPNLVAAVAYGAEHGPRPAAWLLADGLRGYFWLSLYTVDWLTTAQAGLAAARRDGDHRGQAAAHLSLADVYQNRYDYPRAIEHYSLASSLAGRTGWVEGQSASLGNLGVSYWRAGQLEQAAAHFDRALALDRRSRRPAGEAIECGNLASVYQELGLLQDAAEYRQRALALFRQVGSRIGEAAALTNLAATRYLLGGLADARSDGTHALAMHREIGNRPGEAETLRLLAMIDNDTGHPAEALELALSALGAIQDTGEHRLVADVLNAIGAIHVLGGQPQQAVERYHEALALARRVSAHAVEVEARVGLAAAYQSLTEPDRALTEARSARTLAAERGCRLPEGAALTRIASIQLQRGQLDEALNVADQALVIHRETGHRLGAARTHVVLGDALERTGNAEGAILHRRQALAIFADAGCPEVERLRSLVAPHPDRAPVDSP